MRTAFTELVGVQHPVVGFNRSPGVVAEVTNAGVDVLIAQGTEAGGHTGTIATMVLTPEIVDIAEGRPVLDAAAGVGHEGALRLESFFVGQVVGSFGAIRPAAEITRQMVAECEQRITELGALL